MYLAAVWTANQIFESPEAPTRVWRVVQIFKYLPSKIRIFEVWITDSTRRVYGELWLDIEYSNIRISSSRNAVHWLRYDQARQALLSSLEPAELTKVYHLQSAHEIWKRLADKYGGVSDLKRAQANATFYSLKKPKDVPMQSHINQFTKLQQEANYHRESPLSDVDVNLAFLQSLGDDWRTFQQSLGSRIHSISPPTLFAEVLAFEPSKPAAANGPMANALNTKYKHKQKPYDRSSRQSDGKQCRYCKRNGHLIEECLKKRWRDTQARDEEENGAETTSQPWWQQGKGKNVQSNATQSSASQSFW